MIFFQERTHRSFQNVRYASKCTVLGPEHVITQEEQDYRMDEEINFLDKGDIEDEDQTDPEYEDFM